MKWNILKTDLGIKLYLLIYKYMKYNYKQEAVNEIFKKNDWKKIIKNKKCQNVSYLSSEIYFRYNKGKLK